MSKKSATDLMIPDEVVISKNLLNQRAESDD